jgi:hypothetical protein
MAARITIWAAHRVITGRCEKSTANYQSNGANDGHEWEARVGIEDYVDSAVMASPEALHAAITGKQAIVIGAVRAQLLAQGAPAELIDSQPGKLQTSVTPAPEKASPAPPAPVKKSTTWGNAPKAAAEPAQDDDEDGPPPKSGSQFFAWAGKQVDNGRELVYEAWRKAKCKGKVMGADSDSILKAYKVAKQMLAEEQS